MWEINQDTDTLTNQDASKSYAQRFRKQLIQMPYDIVLPNLGFDSQSGRLIEWIKQVGDKVKKGEVLAVIESDKVEVEFESLAEGTIAELCAAEGDEVPVGSVIARLTQDEEQSHRDSVLPTSKITASVAPRPELEATKAPETSIALALPKVRKAARQAGIMLDDILRAGYANPITMQDLSSFQGGKLESPGAKIVVRSPMQQRSAELISRSKFEAPHFYVSGEFDLERVISRLDKYLRLNDLIQYVLVRALQQVPQLNARYENEKLYQYVGVHLAIAVATDKGVIAPVIRNAERYSLHTLASQSKSIIQRAREGRLASSEVQGGTFTISNLGGIKQVAHFTAVINPPQIAIAAVGSVKQRPVVINGGLHLRHTVSITLSGDHRFLDGMTLGQFLQAIQAQLDKLQD